MEGLTILECTALVLKDYLLTDKQWKELLFSSNAQEIYDNLQNTRYQHALKSINKADGNLLQMLLQTTKQEFAQSFQMLYSIANSEQRKQLIFAVDEEFIDVIVNTIEKVRNGYSIQSMNLSFQQMTNLDFVIFLKSCKKEEDIYKVLIKYKPTQTIGECLWELYNRFQRNGIEYVPGEIIRSQIRETILKDLSLGQNKSLQKLLKMESDLNGIDILVSCSYQHIKTHPTAALELLVPKFGILMQGKFREDLIRNTAEDTSLPKLKEVSTYKQLFDSFSQQKTQSREIKFIFPHLKAFLNKLWRQSLLSQNTNFIPFYYMRLKFLEYKLIQQILFCLQLQTDVQESLAAKIIDKMEKF